MKLYKSVTVCLIISIILFTDLCNVDNGGCDDIAECKHAESGVACVCPDGYRLDPSGKQCLGMYIYCIRINNHTSKIGHLGATNNSKNEESLPEHRHEISPCILDTSIPVLEIHRVTLNNQSGFHAILTTLMPKFHSLC